MRRSIGVLLLLFAFLLLLSSPAAAQPTRGANSTEFGTNDQPDGRNANGFGGGPHCHTLAVDAVEPGSITVFPSHTGHANAGGDIFSPGSSLCVVNGG